jgi:hypothetical protein
LLQRLDDVARSGLDDPALRGERAAPVRGTERMVRFQLLVQAGPDEDVIEHALLAFESPQGTALDQVRRDGVQLVPALEAAVGLDDSFQQIGHCSFFLARRLQR